MIMIMICALVFEDVYMGQPGELRPRLSPRNCTHRTFGGETARIREGTEATNSAKASFVGLTETSYHTFFKSPFPQNALHQVK